MYKNSNDIEAIERAITWDTAHLLKGNRNPASSSVSRFSCTLLCILLSHLKNGRCSLLCTVIYQILYVYGICSDPRRTTHFQSKVMSC